MSFVRQFLGLNVWIRVLMFVAFLWGFTAFFFASKLNNNETENTYKRINKAIEYLEQTKLKHEELKSLIDEYLNDNSYHTEEKRRLLEQMESKYDYTSAKNGEPTAEYQHLVRRIRSNTDELWNLVNSELKRVQKSIRSGNDKSAEELKIIDNLLALGVENKMSLINDLDEMTRKDNYEKWRHKESDDLSDLVQRRLEYLQNPEDCRKARKLICRLNKGCGYGCQLHHVVYCFIMAYATERTLILKSKGWRYHKGGWDEVFKPISDTCVDSTGDESHSGWPGQPNTQVLTLPIIDSLNPRPAFLPLAIPADLAPRLTKLHGDPIVWWVGQFLKYLLRPQPETQTMLEEGAKKMGFKKPIVGIHIRRTDKVGTEAALHQVEEYMTAVDEYYTQREMVEHIDVRRVFLASDDPKVIDEARTKYPNYEIIGDQIIARMAAVSTRYTDSSLNGIILDIHLLSLSDYLVCTFSSQVCRIAYEIMQTMYPDASNRFRSLDDIYYYGGQNAHNREAVMSHTPRDSAGHDEMHLHKGDLVGVAGNHWNGFSKGRNVRTSEVGLFPSFKVKDKVETAEFPTYPNVK